MSETLDRIESLFLQHDAKEKEKEEKQKAEHEARIAHWVNWLRVELPKKVKEALEADNPVIELPDIEERYINAACEREGIKMHYEPGPKNTSRPILRLVDLRVAASLARAKKKS